MIPFQSNATFGKRAAEPESDVVPELAPEPLSVRIFISLEVLQLVSAIPAKTATIGAALRFDRAELIFPPLLYLRQGRELGRGGKHPLYQPAQPGAVVIKTHP
jgi:hypothetical protein